MNPFKSPLLLMGIVVILIAAGALVAPYFIDWGKYRADFESYGKQLTGRDTQVKGDISVRLFPWPKMILHDVRVANPDGARIKDLFRADEIEVRLGLAPLLSGKLAVRGVDINRPVIGLERMATGHGSWWIKPTTGLKDIFGAEDVAVEGISITNGTILLADGGRGGQAQLDGFNAVISARSLVGPWKMRGEAVINDEGVTLSINTGKWREGRPFKFGVRLEPSELSGLAYSFDGETAPGKDYAISGRLKIAPQKRKSGKSDLQGNFRPMVFRARIKAGFDKINFAKIEIAPQNSVDAQTFVTGDATVMLGSIIKVDADLKAARFDMDAVLGIRGRKVLRSMETLDVLSGFVEGLPGNVHLRTKLDLSALAIGKDVFDGTQLEFEIYEHTLKIKQLKMALPGQTKAVFTGSLIAGGELPQLNGSLKLDAISLKDFAKWAASDYVRQIEEKWSGARGRFKIEAKIDLSRENLRLQDGVFSLDNTKGKIALNLKTGENPSLGLQFSTNELDVDRYAPEGILGAKAKSDVSGFLVDTLARMVGEQDLNLETSVKRLKMNGVEARDVVINFNADENSIDFRQIKLGNVGNASVDLSGLIRFSDADISGSLKGQVNAANPEQLFQLLNVKDMTPAWLKAVSPLNLAINGKAEAGDKESSGELEVSGNFGATKVSGIGKFKGTLSNWDGARLHLSGKLGGDSARQLLVLFGITADKGKDGPAKVAFTATGTLKEGLASTAEFEAFGVSSQFYGKVVNGKSGPQAQGRLAVLVQNTDKILAVLGVHPGNASPIARVFSGEGVVVADAGEIRLSKIRGTAAGTSFKGDIGIVSGDKGIALTADLSSGRLSLPFVLDMAMLGRDGARHGVGSRFSPDSLSGVSGSVKFMTGKLEMWPGFVVTKSALQFDVEGERVKLKATGEREAGRKVELQLDAQIGENITRASGKISGAMKLSDLLVTNDGKPVLRGDISISGEFAGSGRTPGGILASLSGKGEYELTDGVINDLSPAKFSKSLPGAENAKDVEALIVSQLRTGDMAFGGGKGIIDLQTGVMTLSGLAIKGQGAKGTLKAIYEVGNGLADVSIRLKLNQPADVPGFEIAYAGPPKELAGSSNFSALKSHLSVAALNRTLDKLEALQEEQRRLFEEEQKARAEAAAIRKKQMEKQRLLREKQRELLRKATEKKKLEAERIAAQKAAEKKAKKAKEDAARKAREEKRRQQTSQLPPVIDTPIPAVKPGVVIPPLEPVETVTPPPVPPARTVRRTPLRPAAKPIPLFPASPPPAVVSRPPKAKAQRRKMKTIINQ